MIYILSYRMGITELKMRHFTSIMELLDFVSYWSNAFSLIKISAYVKVN